jgi:hypothetical protein
MRKSWNIGTTLLMTVLMAVTMMLAGCSTVSDEITESEPSIGLVSVIVTPEQVVFPVDAFVPSVDQQVAIALHGQLLVNECAAAHGSSNRYAVGEKNDIGGFRDLLADIRRSSVTRNGFWGSFDPILMRQQGYAAVESSGVLGSGSADDDPILNACIQAVGVVSPTGDVGVPFYISMLPDGGSQWHSEDSRWVAAVELWSACMTERGFGYVSPIEAIGVNSRVYWMPDASEQDRVVAFAVAVADLDCKLETNLIGKGTAIQSAYDQIYVDTHRDELAALQAQIAAFLVAGVEILPDLDSLPSPTSEPSQS